MPGLSAIQSLRNYSDAHRGRCRSMQNRWLSEKSELGPLTPALSRRERENRLRLFGESSAGIMVRCLKKPKTWKRTSSPGGEDRGKGGRRKLTFILCASTVKSSWFLQS